MLNDLPALRCNRQARYRRILYQPAAELVGTRLDPQTLRADDPNSVEATLPERVLLRRAGRADWRTSLLQMVIPDSRAACVLALQPDPALLSEEQRVETFTMTTGAWRATYVRIKAKRGWRLQCDQPDKVVLD